MLILWLGNCAVVVFVYRSESRVALCFERQLVESVFAVFESLAAHL
jgi:hypothetical protein